MKRAIKNQIQKFANSIGFIIHKKETYEKLYNYSTIPTTIKNNANSSISYRPKIIFDQPIIYQEILNTIYSQSSPYFSSQLKYLDSNYPHTNIRPELIKVILNSHSIKFWLELGSFVGGSAILTAKQMLESSNNATLVCCDPFCGDVNMWEWEKKTPVLGRNKEPYKFLDLEDGISTIYKRFLANIFFEGMSHKIIPIQCTSIVAINLLKRLYDQSRISYLPDVIYLDSAHEEEETFLELKSAWSLLPKNGILFGDDWDWNSVRNDVKKFSELIKVNNTKIKYFNKNLENSWLEENIFLYEGQWVLFK